MQVLLGFETFLFKINICWKLCESYFGYPPIVPVTFSVEKNSLKCYTYMYVYIYISKLMLFTSVDAVHWVPDNALTSQSCLLALMKLVLATPEIWQLFVLERHENPSDRTPVNKRVLNFVQTWFCLTCLSVQKHHWSSLFSRRALFFHVFSHFQHPTSIFRTNKKGYHNPDLFKFQGTLSDPGLGVLYQEEGTLALQRQAQSMSGVEVEYGHWKA